ncbi:undecaprenyl-diphosphatase [Spirosomataceae bacterium TFI 002]|nr:undecaprenyl-diphosphatase [Spirosomataceae bacterium TFI 002]
MIFITNRHSWIPLYIIIIGLILYKSWWKLGLFQIVLIIAAVGLADFITSGIMKPFFERPRPCHEDGLAQLVYVPNGCGGAYGFASSHAANSFALATMLYLLFVKSIGKKAALFFLWAGVVSYSRVYVGVHYPLDIIVGAIVGVGCGSTLFFLNIKVLKMLS